VDRATRFEGPEGIGQKVKRRVRQVQDDPVHGRDLPEDRTRVACANRHAVSTIRRYVRAQQLDGDRVRIRGVDFSRAARLRNQDRIGTDPRERIRDDLPVPGQVRDAQSLRGESRAEVCFPQVDEIREAVLEVAGRGPRLPRDDLDLADAVFPFDPAILHDDENPGIPSEDGPSDRLAVAVQLSRDLDDRNVSDDVERAGEGCAQGRRDIGDVFVAPHRNISLGEVSLRDGEPDIHSIGRRDEQAVAFSDDAQMRCELVLLDETPSNLLPAFARDDDAPGSHAAAMRPPAIKVSAAANVHGPRVASPRRWGNSSSSASASMMKRA